MDFGDDTEQPKDDKPFDDEKFDAGVEANEETDPEKFIQQLAGKLGQSLRDLTEKKGSPDFELEKFAINSVISATHTSEMDEEDKNDIIKKINTAGENKKDDEADNSDNQDDSIDDSGDFGDFGGGDSGDDSNDNFGDEEELQELSVYESKLTNLFVNPKKNNMFQEGSNDILDEMKPCWKGYKQVGMKEKNGKEVPNCVPINENEEEGSPTRYMFFSNLEQIRRQAGLLLDLDEDKIEAILNSGHDWAADHIATAKESFDQVFDFLMNETKSGDAWKSVDIEDHEDDYSEWSKPMQVSSDIPVSSDLAYHIQNEIALGESVFRYGSDKFMALLKEVKSLYSKGLITLNENDAFIVNDFDLGYLQVGDDKIKMNFIFEEIEDIHEAEDIIGAIDSFLLNNGFNRIALANLSDDKKIDEFLLMKGYNRISLANLEKKDKINAVNKELNKGTLTEAEYQGKKVEIGKPKRGGSKKFYVYVRNPKTGKVKKVSFGAKSGGGNLAVKLKDPKARKAFADRHNCEQKNDKTKAGYWACRLPRYAKLLGLSGGGKWW